MSRLPSELEQKLLQFARRLLDQAAARVIVAPQQAADGFWFGGGNLTQAPDGDLVLVGRYRNQGDSRRGISAGERGCELALFRSPDQGQTWSKILAFGKDDLQPRERHPVLSIEGSALHWTPDGVELLVSSEQAGVGYPPGLETYLKPGCGVWTIQRRAAESLQALLQAPPETLVQSADPEHLHVKDPHVYDLPDGGLMLMYCTHPFTWSSSNTAFMRRRKGANTFEPPQLGWFPRGTTWDVAMTRGTCLLDVPAVGAFARQRVTLLFYDGGECVRPLDPHHAAVQRPRGYSCEELGGVAYLLDGDFTRIQRLTTTGPLGVSPYGTGCSRYVDVLPTPAGYFATWQQSQPDRSQPLVLNFVPAAELERTLT